jgi:spore coat protein U-like protein
MRRCFCPLLAACMAMVSADARAVACIVNNATLAFGSYNPVSPTPTAANASITVQCADLISITEVATYTLLLSAGSGTVTNRQMTGTASLPYNIYTSAAYATVWDNTSGVAASVTLVGLLGLPILTYGTDTQIAYGRILALRPDPAGSNTDTLIITVSF